MSKVLLIDTNFSSLPIYDALIHEGYTVYTAGNKDTEALPRISTNHINIDYNNTDELIKIIKNENIENIIPGCTDASYASCAKIGERLPEVWHGDNYQNFLKINNKYEFRKIALKIGLPAPEFFQDIQSAKKSKKKLIIKPVDAFSGKGISTVNHDDDKALANAIAYAKSSSANQEFIIEEYVTGQLFSYSAFLSKHSITASFLVQEDCTINPYAVDSSFVVHAEKSALRKKLGCYIEKLSQALHLSDGLIHTQFILNKNKLWLIEITRRCPGDQYGMLIELSTDFPYASQYKNFFIKENKKIITPQSINKKQIIRHTISSKNPGVFKELNFTNYFPIKKFIPLKKSGDIISNPQGERIGLVFIEAKKNNKKYIYSEIINRNFYNII